MQRRDGSRWWIHYNEETSQKFVEPIERGMVAVAPSESESDRLSAKYVQCLSDVMAQTLGG